MKQNMVYIVGIMLGLLLFVGAPVAQSQTSQTYWHTSDYYSIQLNGQGSAFIGYEMNLQSISKQQTNTITLDLPYNNVTVYQVISENSSYAPCIDCVYGNTYNNYENPQFVNYSVTSLYNSTVLTLNLNKTLNQTIKNSSQTTIYIFLSTRNLAYKTLQGYQFSFKTFIDPNALIRESYVTVEVPQNMYLKNQPTYNVNYGTTSAEGSLISATSASSAAAAIPAIFYNPYQYQTNNLLPGQYFTVTGLYGTNQALLYLPEIIVAIIIVVIIILLIIFVFAKRIRRLFSSKQEDVRKNIKANFSLSRSILIGLASGFIFVIAYYALQLLSNFGGYYYNSALSILLGLLGLVICGLALFGLPYYLYSRFNKREGILAGIISIIAAIIYLLIIVYLFPPVYAIPLL
jgi:hypothetical protein